MRKSNAVGVFAAVLLACLGLSSCGGGSYSATQPSADAQTASVFTVGTDASLPSVVSCQIMVTGVTLYNGSANVPESPSRRFRPAQRHASASGP